MRFLRKYDVPLFVFFCLVSPAVFGWLSSQELIRATYFEFCFLLMPVAAFGLTAITRGRGAFMDMLKSALHWRVHWGWYAVALFSIPAIQLATVLVFQALTGTLGEPLKVDWYDLTHFNAWFLIVVVAVSISDEVAWFSFTLPRMIERHNAFGASLVIGFFWFISYLPRYFLSDMVADRTIPIPVFALSFITLAPICAWIYLSTKSGVVLVLMQVVGNYTVLTLPVLPQATGSPYTMVVKVALMGAISVALAAIYGTALVRYSVRYSARYSRSDQPRESS
jgi:hypothetical protein